MLPNITGVFCHILVFVEMFVMYILHLHIDGDLMYFMTNDFVTKNKFLLQMCFLVYAIHGSFYLLYVFFF